MKFINTCLLLFIGITIFGQSLEELIQSAKDHPRFRVYDSQIEGTHFQEEAATAWKDPQFQIGFGVSPLETRVGPQVVRFGVLQSIPFSGIQKAKRAEVDAKRSVLEEDQMLSFRELKHQIQSNYLEYYLVSKKEEFYKLFLKIYDQIREDRVRNMQRQMGHYSDVLVVDRMIHQTKRALQKTLFEKERSLIALSYWSGEELGDSLDLRTDFKIQNQQANVAIHVEAHPSIRKIEAQKQTLEAQQAITKASKWPGIQIGFDYLVHNSRSGVEIPDNGRDGLIPKVGLTIPISGKYYHNHIQSRSKEIEALEFQHADQIDWLTRQTEEARLLQEDALEEFTFFQDQISRTKEIIELIEIEIGSDHTRFLEYWEYQKQMLDYRLRQLESIRQWYQAAFLIEKLQTQSDE